MHRTTRASFLASTTVAILAGCSSPSSGPIDAAADAPAEVAPPPPRTLTFVIDQLTIDLSDSPDDPHTGLNLDDLYSTDIDPLGCTHRDYYSLYDNDQHCAAASGEHCTVPPGCSQTDPGCIGGVDNQLPTLANTIRTAASFDIRPALSDSVAQSRLVLLVRVGDVNDLINDPSVGVSIYRGNPTFGSDCASVLPGREYAVDSASLIGGTDVDVNARVRLSGSIVDGRLRIRAVDSASSVELPIAVGGSSLQFQMRALQLRANIADDGLSNGSFGGWVKGDDFFTPCCFQCCDLNVMRAVIGGLVDVQLDGLCDGSANTPPTWGGISLGFGIHAVRATIAPMIANGPMPGTCGYVVPDGGRPGG